MNIDHSTPPFPPAVSSTVASSKTQHSNRASPFQPIAPPPPLPFAAASNTSISSSSATPVPTTKDIANTGAQSLDQGLMAAPGFVPATQAFRHGPSSQPPYLSGMNGSHFFEREQVKPVGTPFNTPASPMVRVLIRRLPLNTSEESLRLMVVWSKELADVELLPVEQSEDSGFRSALLKFRSMAGAMEAKNMLDGRSNISNDAEMIVEVLGLGPGSARRHTSASQDTKPSSATSSNSSGPGQRQPSRFNGSFTPLERISPTSNGTFSAHDFPNPDASAHYQNLFSPQSPIGNHLTERLRISGKSLISDDFGDDDETSDLLKDPVAYAENGAPSHRRATAPQIPISQMTNLSLNTTHSPGPASLPPYMSPISPTSGPAGVNYPIPNGQHYQRHNFPAVNPADQNPPCNTLYVGNLPIDTSEEELKAMFSKQRGYKRLCFRTKQNGPMCFVEFEDVSFATKALHELYGHPLHNSVKGGIRLSFSKNPLGVRSGHTSVQASAPPMGSMNGMMAAPTTGFTTANGPPPGLAAPPGLGTGRVNYNLTSLHTGGHSPYPTPGFPGSPNHPWNGPGFGGSGLATGPNGPVNGGHNLPRHMMGR